jgi:hypothetical protein
MLKKLGTDAIPASRQKSITLPTTLHYVCCACPAYNKDESLSTLSRTLSRNLSLDELDTALMSLKPGKAARFDEIYPEFIKNFGAQTKKWIISFMNDIVSTSKNPNLFKRAKVISIIKPGKDGTDPAHYRPISLLSV